MAEFKDLFQTADWKSEKHVPVIDAPDRIKKEAVIQATVTVGKEIPHPNVTEHHIRWIELYFHPQGEKFPYEVGRFEFNAHGESVQGPNSSTLYTQPVLTCHFKSQKSGMIFAFSYCNIHGLWQGSRPLVVE